MSQRSDLALDDAAGAADTHNTVVATCQRLYNLLPIVQLATFFADCQARFAPRMKDRVALFWSRGGQSPETKKGVPYEDRAREIATSFKWVCLSRLLPVKTDDKPRGIDGQIFSHILASSIVVHSMAMARFASGSAYLMMSPDGLADHSHWTRYEWPEIVRAGKVARLMFIDPDTKSISLLWLRSDGFTGPWPLRAKPSDKIVFPLRGGHKDYRILCEGWYLRILIRSWIDSSRRNMVLEAEQYEDDCTKDCSIGFLGMIIAELVKLEHHGNAQIRAGALPTGEHRICTLCPSSLDLVIRSIISMQEACGCLSTAESWDQRPGLADRLSYLIPNLSEMILQVLNEKESTSAVRNRR